MSITEHSAITFLKKHGKELLEKERQKYEPIKQEIREDELKELRKENAKLKTKTNIEWLD